MAAARYWGQLDRQARSRLDAVIAEFESAWQQGQRPEIGRFVDAAVTERRLILQELIHVDLELRRKVGFEAEVESYLRQFPDLSDEPEALWDLISHDIELQRNFGREIDLAGYCRRFPQYAGRLSPQGETEAGGEKPAARMAAESTDRGPGETRPPALEPAPDAAPPGDAVVREGLADPSRERPLLSPRDFADYELLAEIGQGGMGVVYRARHRSLERTVALKMIRSGCFASPREMDRFRREAQAAARVQHPGIVRVLEVGDQDGQPFFAMDYVDGNSLAALTRQSVLPARQAADYVRGAAEAIHAAHLEGVIHRDLKPANILVDRRGQPRIADFGLARRLDDDSHLTMSGEALGTASYMPPEQASGQSGQIGPASDVYSLGATLYHLLTRRPPFCAANAYETLQQVLQVEPVSPRLLNPGVPRDLETICLKCLQKDKTGRYASAQELADELGRFLADEPIRARPVGRRERVWRWCRRKPAVAAALGFAALCLLGAAVALGWGYLSTASALETAESRLDQALGTIDTLFTEVADEMLLDEPGQQRLRKRLLYLALDQTEELLAEEEEAPRIRQALARSYFSVGRIRDEVDSSEEAIEPLRMACEMQVRLLSERPGDASLRRDLADSYSALGAVFSKLWRYGEAQSWLRDALAVRRQVVAEIPTHGAGQSQLAEDQRKLANALMNLGLANQQLLDFEGAFGCLEEAQKVRKPLLERHPVPDKVKRDLAKGHYNLAELCVALSDLAYERHDDIVSDGWSEQAIRELDQAVYHFGQLLEAEHPKLSDRYFTALCYRRKGDHAEGAEAMRMYDKALDLILPLAETNLDAHDYQGLLGIVYMEKGNLLLAQGNHDASQDHFQKAEAVLTSLVDGHPHDPSFRADLALTWLGISLCHAHRSPEKAADAVAHSIQNFRKLIQIYAGRREPEKAIACLQKGLQLAPEKQDLKELLRELKEGGSEE